MESKDQQIANRYFLSLKFACIISSAYKQSNLEKLFRAVLTGKYCVLYLFADKYVMKLFDRSVDLAQFEENTPLYPICRAWMRNQPQKRDLSCLRSSSPDPDPNSGLSDDEVGAPVVSLYTDVRREHYV